MATPHCAQMVTSYDSKSLKRRRRKPLERISRQCSELGHLHRYNCTHVCTNAERHAHACYTANRAFQLRNGQFMTIAYTFMTNGTRDHTSTYIHYVSLRDIAVVSLVTLRNITLHDLAPALLIIAYIQEMHT